MGCGLSADMVGRKKKVHEITNLEKVPRTNGTGFKIKIDSGNPPQPFDVSNDNVFLDRIDAAGFIGVWHYDDFTIPFTGGGKVELVGYLDLDTGWVRLDGTGRWTTLTVIQEQSDNFDTVFTTAGTRPPWATFGDNNNSFENDPRDRAALIQLLSTDEHRESNFFGTLVLNNIRQRQLDDQAAANNPLGILSPVTADEFDKARTGASQIVDLTKSLRDFYATIGFEAQNLSALASGLGFFGRNIDNATPPRLFPNLQPADLAAELAEAARLGATPLKFADEGFEAVVNSGKIKFIVNEFGEVVIIPHTVNTIEISHAVLSRGRPVLAAGEADIAGSAGNFVGVLIDNRSGHFMPTLESLTIARQAFESIGIVFP